MDTAVNPPISHPELATGSMLYGLAHEALQSEVYKKFLGQHQRYLILDNGADELGTGLSGTELYQLMREVNASEIILPDVLGNPELTKNNSEVFYSSFLQGDEEVLSRVNVQAVAQGMTHEAFLECYLHWLECDYVDVIGIPYDIEFDSKYYGEGESNRDTSPRSVVRGVRRLEFIEYIHTRGMVGKPLHLLGYNSMWELHELTRRNYRYVRSNDTTAPFAAAFNEISFADMDGGRYKNWSAMDFKAILYGEKYNLAIKNLHLYYRACGDMDAILNLGMLMGKMNAEAEQEEADREVDDYVYDSQEGE